PTHRSTFLATGSCPSLFSFTAPATTEIYTLSLHDALPISWLTWYTGGLEAAIALHVVHNLAAFTLSAFEGTLAEAATGGGSWERSEEHTSELQSRENLVCRLLLEKKKTKAIDKNDEQQQTD